ncbi:MAG: hypothetical protein J5878_01990, partial [Oscillospiraceae bacterium]|nr:hypothetical protein [Oscillospiraceae bacterium]
MCSICGCQRLIACCVSGFKSLQNHRLTLHRNDNQIGVVGILAGVGDWGNCNNFFSLFLRQLEVLDLACVVQLADFFQPVAGRQGERKLLQPLRAGLYISTQKFRRWFGIIQIFTGYERFGTEERCSSKGELRRCGEAAFENPYFDILSEGLPAILPRGAGPVGKSHRLQQLLAFACFQWKENKSFIAAFAKKHPIAASKQDVKISWLREKNKCNRFEKNQHQRIFVTSELQFCSNFCQGREGGKPCPQAFDCGKTSRHT